MPSGPKRVQYNNLERLVSNDFNRAQAFQACAQQQAWRARYNDAFANSRLYPGVSEQRQVTAAPAYGEVYAGLFVRPDAGSYLLVEPGLAMILDTTGAGTNDSPYIFADDPGLADSSVLTFTPNASAATVRWDVVECSVGEAVLESSSRDIYNPATGLFAPSIETKVAEGRLTYRLRLGTAGSGYPGAALGWLPLAVVAVRDGATSFAECDLWDVRPLVSDRVAPQQVSTTGAGVSPIVDAQWSMSSDVMFGTADVEFGGYRLGGALRPTTCFPLAAFGATDVGTGGSAPGFTYSQTANQGSYTPTSNGIYYVAALLPKDPLTGIPLPRWARYSQLADPTFGRRVPNGTRGILVTTTIAPGENGIYSATDFPAGSQLVVQGTGACVAVYTTNGLAAISSSFQGRSFRHGVSFLSGTNWTVNGINAANKSSFTLTPGVHFPVGAKKIRGAFRLFVTHTQLTTKFELVSYDATFSTAFPVDRLHMPTGLIPSTGSTVLCAAGANPVSISRPTLRDLAFPGKQGDPALHNWLIQAEFYETTPGDCVVNIGTFYIHGWDF